MGNKNANSRKSLRKEIRQRVFEKLSVALFEFKGGMKDKKFQKTLKKASKLFTADVKPSKVQTTTIPKIPKKKLETESLDHTTKAV